MIYDVNDIIHKLLTQDDTLTAVEYGMMYKCLLFNKRYKRKFEDNVITIWLDDKTSLQADKHTIGLCIAAANIETKERTILLQTERNKEHD